MAHKRTCETCAFWKGGPSSYNGDCGNAKVLHSRTPFDFGCQEYGFAASQQVMNIVSDAVAKAMQAAFKKPRRQP
jgi:hypothetical protein